MKWEGEHVVTPRCCSRVMLLRSLACRLQSGFRRRFASSCLYGRVGGWEGAANCHIHPTEWTNQFLMPDGTWLALVNRHCTLDSVSHVSLYLLSKIRKTERESGCWPLGLVDLKEKSTSHRGSSEKGKRFETLTGFVANKVCSHTEFAENMMYHHNLHIFKHNTHR